MTDRRAIVFDLDDTLYPYRAFVRSGFREVSRRVAAEHQLPVTAVLRVLHKALRHGERGRELQALCAAFRLPSSIVPSLVSLVREHVPVLRLPRETTRVLAELRHTWTIGILTNGTARIQERKVDALGLHGLVDAIVYATACGDGAGKPSGEAFAVALDRLGADPAATVFVGDDLQADIHGARAAGLKTIHMLAHRSPERGCGSFSCGAHVKRLAQVPNIAALLVPVRIYTHAV